MPGSTKQLTDELSKREGVQTVTVEAHQEFKITAGREVISLTGPAVILINQD